ncbi:hypothetical protein C8Q80DRAFT_1117872 [Daedaleopsis nitida]|nr:hypothetical protein C8Q80DRAFT_1117872 [Daedaleopsis nitida]
MPIPMLPKLPPVDDTLGAVLIGTFLSIFFQGLISHQAYYYYRTYPNDRWFLKLWVAAVVILEVFSVICTMHGSYYYLVTHYADPTVLLKKAPWSMVCSKHKYNATGLTSRAHVLDRVRSTSISTLVTTNLTTASIAMDIVSDVLLTSALIYILHTSRTGFQGTTSMVDVLVRYTMGTGLLIGLVNIVFIATDQVYTSNLIPGAVGITETKIYGISFLVAICNANKSLQT